MRKNLILSAFLFFLSLGVSFGREPLSTVTYRHSVILGASVDIIKVDLKDSRISITPAVAKNFPNRPEQFETMVKRENPVAAINGNFFSTVTFRPVGDIVIDEELVYFGGLGTAMAITSKNKIEFIKVEPNRHMNWDGYKAVISCGPKLIENGKIILNAKAEGFRDPELFERRARSAVGVTYDDYLILVSINDGVYFRGLAEIMQELGCKEAMNLDGGQSCGMYYKGEFLRRPKTPLPNILVIDQKDIQPNFLASLKDDLLQGETRIEIFSKVALVLNKDELLLKGVNENEIFLIMRFDSPRFFEAPQLGAKMDFSYNKLTISFPAQQMKELFMPSNI